jgi:O-antigen/teichoic acid export membrane protein
MINETFDRVLLKKLLPSDIADYQVSIYSAFYKLSLVLTLFVQAFRFSAEPFFFQQAKSLDAKHMYAYVMKWFVYAVALIYLMTIVVLPQIAHLLIRNPKYFTDPNGMAIVPILLGANMCLGIYYTLSVWYKVSGQTGIGTIPAFIGAGITLILNVWLIPKLGFVGSAYTTLIAYASMVLFGYILCQKYYPIPYPIFPIVSSIIIAVGSGYFIIHHENHTYSILFKIAAVMALLLFIYGYEKWTKTKNSKHESLEN